MSRGQMCVTMQNFIKIGQMFLEILRFFYFQDGGRPPSWIFNFFLTNRLGSPMCIIKIGQTVAAIYFFFKMAAIHHFGFVGCILDDLWRVLGGLYYCAKFGQNHCSRFDNTKFWIFCVFGLKCTCTPFWGILGWGKRNFLHIYPSRKAITQNWHHTNKTA